MTQSKTFPKIQKLQGSVLVPYNVHQVERADEIGTETFYEYGVLKIPKALSFGEYQALIWRQLQSELHQHIYAVYNQGEQASISGYAIKASSLGRTDITEACLPVQEWIDSVLDYYDSKKVEIFATTSKHDLISVTWDYSVVECPAKVDWRVIKAMF